MDQFKYYEVWHVTSEAHEKSPWGFTNPEKAGFVFPDDYERVAIVIAADLGELFYLTNHVDSNWTEGGAVHRLFNKKARSTSVSDVVIDPDGNRLRCESVGWKEIS